MATEVRLPQAGMGMTDGTVMEWLKDVGEQVRKGECIAEVEAAKTTVEIEAPCDGILARILAPAGTLVPVREIMALIVSPDDPSAGSAGQPPAEPADEARVRPRPLPTEAGEVQVVPAARRLAREHGIPLTDVPGSGPGGRITEADGTRIEQGPGASVPARIEQGPGASVLPLAGTRGVIARRMLASLQGSAQYTLVRAVDVTALTDWHDRGARPGGVTYADAVARAVVLSLAEHPNLNAHITGEQVLLASAIDLGIGIDTDDGLVVGVLRNVGDLGLAELSAIIWRKSMTLSLTVDHRAVDGAPAARFLAGVADRLQAPAELL